MLENPVFGNPGLTFALLYTYQIPSHATQDWNMAIVCSSAKKQATSLVKDVTYNKISAFFYRILLLACMFSKYKGGTTNFKVGDQYIKSTKI